MKKAKIAGTMASVIVLALLTGCAAQTAASQTESESTSASSASFSVSAGSSGSVPAKSQVVSSAPTASSGQTVVSSIPNRPQTSNLPASAATPSSREITPAATMPEKPAEPAPVPAEAPTPSPAPAPLPAPSSTPAPPPAPAFDVSQWVNLGISYGQSIGLEADSSVTGSWDNPIIAGPNSRYLERDICGMLDWYKASGFTRFWVWASPRIDGKFDLYIGYS